ncbi:MAG: LysR family transcriptional regulator, partial [Alphaproteobacteria bacterium]|nr:LysR family transcriptional regulator [Alphaproteobacteria bacterium]
MKRLPSLKAIKAFEACYRLRSFTRAAQSLNVQQPAISHQLRILETDLNTKLFIKKGAQIEPTREADIYYETVSSALNEIASASDKIRGRQDEATMTLATYPGVGAFWVLPKAQEMKNSYPDLKMRITTLEKDSEISIDEVDCAILFGDGNWPGFCCEKLIEEDMVPIVSPKIADQYKDMTAEQLLASAPIIYLEDSEARWLNWHQWRDIYAPSQRDINISMSISNY